ncbi:MAG: hypothetical protein M3R00_07685, partial [Pseudomonadota bacterium]|nr:hypothetical protein [Pseudomonadota bacterium]
MDLEPTTSIVDRFRFCESSVTSQKIVNRLYELNPRLDISGYKFLFDRGFNEATVDHFAWKTIGDKSINRLKREFELSELILSGLFSESGGFKFHF